MRLSDHKLKYVKKEPAKFKLNADLNWNLIWFVIMNLAIVLLGVLNFLGYFTKLL